MTTMSENPARLVLIDPRGSGKTTVGRLVAAHLGWPFLDADDEIEARAGCTIAAIFAGEGEAGFREREAAVVHELAGRDRHVIATGGGIVLREDNRHLLRSSGHCVWLTGDPATLYQRLQGDPTTRDRRPALTDLPGPAEVERLLREREPLYRAVAHSVVDTGGRSPAEVVSAILSAWPSSSTSR